MTSLALMAAFQFIVLTETYKTGIIAKRSEGKWCEYNDSYINTYASGGNSYHDLKSAQDACLANYNCGGITQEPTNSNRYSLRAGREVKRSSSGETSWTTVAEPLQWCRQDAGYFIPGDHGLPFSELDIETAQAICAVTPNCGIVSWQPDSNSEPREDSLNLILCMYMD